MKKQFVINDYLYRLKRKNQTDSVIYVCTIKSCGRLITWRNDVTIKSNGRNHNRTPTLADNVQAILTGLKSRVLTDNDQSIGTTKSFFGSFLEHQ